MEGLKIVVCSKTITDPDLVTFDVVKEEFGAVYPIPDPMDEYLLEEAIRIREKHGGEIIVLSAGPEEIEKILEKTLRFGADRAIRIWDDGLMDPDTWMISQVIEKGLRGIEFDLVLCGSRSSDTGSGTFVPLLARNLDLPCICGVVSMEFEAKTTLVAHKKLERGMREEYVLAFPAVLGLDPGINLPRYVAPYSKVYCRGMQRSVERMTATSFLKVLEKRVSVGRLCQRKPRVKKGINTSALSMQDRLRMMRGELGDKKRRFQGEPAAVAREILKEIKM